MCNCLSGRKRVGCCVHVAAIIWYLSWGRFHNFRLPGQYLNEIFVNFNEKEATNCPKYVRNDRSLELNSDSSDDSDNSIDSFSSDNSDSTNDSDSSMNSSVKSESNDSLVSLDSTVDTLLDDFKNHVPKWGAIITYNGKKVELTNTCSIDYFLL